MNHIEEGLAYFKLDGHETKLLDYPNFPWSDALVYLRKTIPNYNTMSFLQELKNWVRYFDGRVSFEEGVFTAVSSRVILKEVNFGPFKIEYKITAEPCVFYYHIKVIALEPNIHHGHCHPHIDENGSCCLGEAEHLYKFAISNHRPLDVFYYLDTFLNNHAEIPAHDPLRWLTSVLCPACGSAEGEDRYCESCRAVICSECNQYCEECESRYCSDCMDENGYCNSCTIPECQGCLNTDHLNDEGWCPDCKPQCAECEEFYWVRDMTEKVTVDGRSQPRWLCLKCEQERSEGIYDEDENEDKGNGNPEADADSGSGNGGPQRTYSTGTGSPGVPNYVGGFREDTTAGYVSGFRETPEER